MARGGRKFNRKRKGRQPQGSKKRSRYAEDYNPGNKMLVAGEAEIIQTCIKANNLILSPMHEIFD